MLKIKHIVAVLAFALAASFFAPTDAHAQAAADPMDFTATADGINITLMWTNSTTTSATHYVRWRANNAGDWRSRTNGTAGDDNAACTATDVSGCGSDQTGSNGGMVFPGLQAGTSYTFAIAAHVTGGSSSWVTATATRNKNRAELSMLTISPGTLAPTFMVGTTVYAATVTAASVTITAPAARDGTVAITDSNGTAVTGAQTLNFGDNVYTVTVTAQDGVVANAVAHTVTITRVPLAPTAVTAAATTGSPNVVFNWTNSASSGAAHHVRWRAGTTGDWVSRTGSTNSADNADCIAADVSACGDNRTSEQSSGITFGAFDAGTAYNIAIAAVVGGVSSAWVNASVTTNRATAEIATLTLSTGTVNETVAAGTTAYTATVPFGTNTITVTATAGAGGSVTAGTGTAQTLSLVGINALTNIVVTSENGDNTQTYTLMVTRSEPTITNIVVSTGTVTLTPSTFAVGTTAYTGTANIGTVNWTATFTVGTMTIRKGSGNNTSITSATASGNIGISAGSNVITFVYTENSQTRDYVYTITGTSSDATLSELTVNGTRVTGFSPGDAGGTYSATVPFAVNMPAIVATVNQADATVSGATAPTVTIGDNDAAVTVIVTAQDTTTTQTYIINITRGTAEVVDIRITTPSGTTYTPDFDRGTAAYAVTVASDVTAVAFTPTFIGVGATMTGQKTSGTAGSSVAITSTNESSAFTLETSGATTIDLVYLQTLTFTYTFTITKASATDATLSGITLADSDGTTLNLAEAFASATTTYTFGAVYAVDSIDVGATATNPAANISGTGTVSLPLGVTTVTLTVSPVSGTDQDYTITITRASPAITSVAIATAGASPTTATITLADTSVLEYTGTIAARIPAAGLTGTASGADAANAQFRVGTSGGHTVGGTAIVGAVARAVVVQMRYRETLGSTNVDTTYTFTLTQPPAAPGAPTLVGNDEQLNVNWTAPTDTGGGTISEYTVEWSVAGANAYDGSATATETSHAIVGLANNTAYDVRVSGTNEAGGGTASTAVEGTAAIPGVPEAPTTLAAESEANEELTLTWVDPTAAGDSAIANYRVRWRVAGTSDYGSPIQANASPFTLADLANKQNYDVQVAAANAQGIGVYSAAVTATTGVDTAPSAPRPLDTAPSVVTADASITVNWRPVADEGSSQLTGYTVDWKLSSDSAYLAANTAAIASNTRTHEITMIDPGDGTPVPIVDGTSYDIRVIALTGATTNDGASPELLFANVESGAPAATAAPSVPRNIEFVAGDGSLAVTWDAPLTGTPALYDVRWKKAAAAAFAEGDVMADIAAATQTHTIDEIDNGVRYEVQVNAKLADDNDPDTNEASPYASATGTPGALSAPTAPLFLEVTGTNGGLALQWAPPAEDGGMVVTGYSVRWKLASESRYGAVTGVGDVGTYRIDNLTRGMQYDVQVAATNDIARGLWAGLRATPAGLPSAPRTVQLTPGETSMGVAWRIPESDGGAQLANYVVEWKLSTDAIYSSAKVNGTSYTIQESTDPVIAALVVDTAYDVRVAATNRFGDVFTESVQATTAAAAVVPTAPLNVAVESGGETSLAVSWEPPSNNGGQRVSGYRVSWEDPAFVPTPAPQAAGGGTTRTEHTGSMTVGANATSATITGLTAGTAYTVSVAAMNGVGEVADLTLATAAPATPAALPVEDMDSTLSALAATGLTKVNPAADDAAPDDFVADHFAYEITTDVIYATQVVMITPTAMAAATSTIEIGVDRLVEVASGTAASVPVNVGDNRVRIVVTAEDGSDTTYTVDVARAGPTNFMDLVLTGVMLKGEFDSRETEYSFDVAPTLTQVTLEATLGGNATALITHSDAPAMPLTSGNVSTPIGLNPGANQVVITYDENGVATDYRFTFNTPSAASTERIESFLSSAGAAILSSALDVIGDNALNAPSGTMNAAFFQSNYNTQTERALTLLSEESRYRDADWRDLLGASSFRLALDHEDGASGGDDAGALGGGTWSVWGAGDVRAYNSGGDAATDGMGYAGYLGTDYRADNWLAGIAVGYTTTAGTITTTDAETDAEFWLAAGYPYVRYTPIESVDIWLMAGVGAGTFTLDEPDPDTPSEKYSVLLLHHLYALGAKAELARMGDFSVAAKTDGSAYFATSLSGEDDDIDVMQQRFRVAVDFAYDYKTDVHALRPHLEVGGRFEFGNAESDLLMGAEIAAGVRYEHMPSRISIDARGRALVYDNSDSSTVDQPGILREWGAGATLRLAPNALGTGLSASLTPGWGTPASRADDMWNSNGELTLVDPSNAASLSAELAYTMRHKQALVTPLAQYSLNAAHQTVGVGTRLNLSVLSMELLGEQVNRTATPTDEYRLRLTSKLRF